MNMKSVRQIVFFIVILVVSSSCGGSGGGLNNVLFSEEIGQDSFFPLYKGLKASFKDGIAGEYVFTTLNRSYVNLEVIGDNILQITSNLEYSNYNANCTEKHELIVDGESIKLTKSTTILEWSGDEPDTWTHVWEYDPPVTLISDRSNIAEGDIVTQNVTITHSGKAFEFTNSVTEEVFTFSAPGWPIDFVVSVSKGEAVTLEDIEVETYEFQIDWIHGLEILPSDEFPRYSTFEGFSILSAGFRLAQSEGIVAFGEGVIRK